MRKKLLFITLFSSPLFAGKEVTKKTNEVVEQKKEELTQEELNKIIGIDDEMDLEEPIQIFHHNGNHNLRIYQRKCQQLDQMFSADNYEHQKYSLKEKPFMPGPGLKVFNYLTAQSLANVRKSSKYLSEIFHAVQRQYPALVLNEERDGLNHRQKASVRKHVKTFSQNPSIALSPNQTEAFIEQYWTMSPATTDILQSTPVLLSIHGVLQWAASFFNRNQGLNNTFQLGGEVFRNVNLYFTFDENGIIRDAPVVDVLTQHLNSNLLSHPHIFFCFESNDLHQTSGTVVQHPAFFQKVVAFADKKLSITPRSMSLPSFENCLNTTHSLHIPTVAIDLNYGTQQLMPSISTFLKNAKINSLNILGFTDQYINLNRNLCAQLCQDFCKGITNGIKHGEKIPSIEEVQLVHSIPSESISEFFNAISHFPKVRSLSFLFSGNHLSSFCVDPNSVSKIRELRFVITKSSAESYVEQKAIIEQENGWMDFMKSAGQCFSNIKHLDISRFIFSAEALKETPQMLEVFGFFPKVEALTLRVEPSLLVNLFENNSSQESSLENEQQDFEAFSPFSSPKNTPKKEEDLSKAFSKMSLEDRLLLAPKRKTFKKNILNDSFDSMPGDTNDSENMPISHYEIDSSYKLSRVYGGPKFLLVSDQIANKQSMFADAINQMKHLKCLNLVAGQPIFDKKTMEKIHLKFPNLEVNFSQDKSATHFKMTNRSLFQ